MAILELLNIVFFELFERIEKYNYIGALYFKKKKNIIAISRMSENVRQLLLLRKIKFFCEKRRNFIFTLLRESMCTVCAGVKTV